jgi:putative tryptophan/tyrosine transport system substrate-binding protein
MTRRTFITLLVGATAWPLTARAQQPERMRRIGVLMNTAADDTVFQIRLGAFLQGLAVLGWTIGRNMRIEIRWSGGKADDARRYAAELVAFAPDVILAHGVSTVRPLLQATWRGRAAMPPVSCRSNTLSAGNGWNCSKRSRRA